MLCWRGVEEVGADFFDGGCLIGDWERDARGCDAGVADEEVDVPAFLGDDIDCVLERGFGSHVAGDGVNV